MLKKFLPLAVVGLLAGCNGGSDETAAEFDYPAEFALPAVNENLSQTSPEGVWMISGLTNETSKYMNQNVFEKSAQISIVTVARAGDDYQVNWCFNVGIAAELRTFVAQDAEGQFEFSYVDSAEDYEETESITLNFNANNLQLSGIYSDYEKSMLWDEELNQSTGVEEYRKNLTTNIKGVKISDASTISEGDFYNTIRANIKQAGNGLVDTDSAALSCISYSKENLKVVENDKTIIDSQERFSLAAVRNDAEFRLRAYRYKNDIDVIAFVDSDEMSFSTEPDEDYLEDLSEDLAFQLAAVSKDSFKMSVTATNTLDDSIDLSFDLTPLVSAPIEQ